MSDQKNLEVERRRMYDEHWHLDKRVPIAMIFAIFIQTAGAFWWASDISRRVTTLEANQAHSSILVERIVKLETVLSRLDKTLDKLEKKMDK